MKDLIQISKLNDYLFCPRSIYFHFVYGNFSSRVFHEKEQRRGKISHENIDRQKYSTLKKYIQGLEVYSEKYGLIGKIDIYDQDEKVLIERKFKVKEIYKGYKFQLYAQYLCLKEMGKKVKSIFIHSLVDNKRTEIALPGKKDIQEIEKVIKKINSMEVADLMILKNSQKCKRCIYKPLCHK